jgi:GNAT superfamily N-acetyltransferase
MSSIDRMSVFLVNGRQNATNGKIHGSQADMSIEIVHRQPTTAEFAAITAAVGFKPHPDVAIAVGLANSFCGVCAVDGERVVGVGRIIGDGALHFYLTGIMVMPDFQRRGIGTRIVEALLHRVKQVPYANTLIEALPLPGLESFYERFGFKACRQYAPGMHLWMNTDAH